MENEFITNLYKINMKKKKEDPRVVENQAKFCEAYAKWIYSNKTDKKAWEVMFLCVQLACENICKSKAYGIQVEDLEGKALDAACNCMTKLQTFSTIEECPKLSSWVYLYSVGQLWNAKHRRWEQSAQFEEVFDNYATITDNDGFISICTSGYNN